MRKSPRTASSRSCLRRATRSRRKLKPARNTITGWLPAQKRRTRPKTRKSRSNSSNSSSTRNCKSTTYQLSKKKRLSRARSRPKTLLANRWTRNRKRPSRHNLRSTLAKMCTQRVSWDLGCSASWTTTRGTKSTRNNVARLCEESAWSKSLSSWRLLGARGRSSWQSQKNFLKNS